MPHLGVDNYFLQSGLAGESAVIKLGGIFAEGYYFAYPHNSAISIRHFADIHNLIAELGKITPQPRQMGNGVLGDIDDIFSRQRVNAFATRKRRLTNFGYAVHKHAL